MPHAAQGHRGGGEKSRLRLKPLSRMHRPAPPGGTAGLQKRSPKADDPSCVCLGGALPSGERGSAGLTAGAFCGMLYVHYI